MNKPSVARNVHYNAGNDQSPRWLAALITAVHSDECVNLAVFDENGEHYGGQTSVTLGEDHHCWRWPPRV